MLETILMACKISRAFNLQGEFYIDKNELILEEHDCNPTIRINLETKEVHFAHQGNIREVILAGVKQLTAQAGFTYVEELLEREDTPEIKRIKELFALLDSTQTGLLEAAKTDSTNRMN